MYSDEKGKVNLHKSRRFFFREMARAGGEEGGVKHSSKYL
jgi:hypothetical protein